MIFSTKAASFLSSIKTQTYDKKEREMIITYQQKRVFHLSLLMLVLCAPIYIYSVPFPNEQFYYINSVLFLFIIMCTLAYFKKRVNLTTTFSIILIAIHIEIFIEIIYCSICSGYEYSYQRALIMSNITISLLFTMLSICAYMSNISILLSSLTIASYTICTLITDEPFLYSYLPLIIIIYTMIPLLGRSLHSNISSLLKSSNLLKEEEEMLLKRLQIKKEELFAFAELLSENNPEEKTSSLLNIIGEQSKENLFTAALAAMIAWLSHSQELGHKPAEIECTGTFVLHDMTYYIFKYKDTKDSEWLLGVNGGYEGDSLSDCGHTFSEMEPYDEKTAVKDATALVEMVRSYWMEQAKQAEEREKKAGTFVGFALLSDNSWDKEKYIRDLKEQWDITAEEKSDEERNPESLVFDVGDMMAAVSLMPAPVPNGEAEECAKNNYMWSEAEKTAKEHKAHIMVAVIGKEESLIERGKLYVKLLSVCCHQKNITGIYTSGVVFQPRFYEGFSGMMKEDSLPIYNWIWFGLYRTEKGISGYTYGMECFGKDEMEVLDVDADPSKVRDFLASMAGYVLEYDAVLNDGETIGFSAVDKHRITRGQGVALPDKVTLKISYGSEDDADGGPDFPDDTDEVMDDAEGHLEKFKEKDLPLDTITAYNHLAIYLRWCMVNDLMRDDFLEQFGDLVSRIKSGSADDDLRVFIKDNLNGQLTRFLFNKQGRAFADYYYGSYYGANETPFYPGDIDNHALDYFGPERYHSDEFKEEAYLFVPYDEDYYQAMSQRIDRRFANWQGLHIDKDTVEPDELARAFMDYLDCECTYFPSMSDDDPIMSAYTYAQRLGVREGFIPVLVNVDEGLWENIIGNSDPDSESSDDYTFNREKVNEFRRRLLEAPVMDGKSILDKLTGQDNDDIDEEPEGGFDNNRYSSYWNTDTNMTHPLILARIPVTEPWKIFAYLPFGNWNDCPANPELMAISKYWYEEYGAVPGTFTSDQLEYELPAPVPEDRAMEAAIQQYAFCPDMDQSCDGIGSLADTLRQSRIWYFWWD